MYYGVYKGVRDSAWQCLLDFDIDRLPVDVLKITRAAGIPVIKNSVVNELGVGEYGISYFDGNKWYIIYDDTRSTEQSRFTIAHEIGHIFLGHELLYYRDYILAEFKQSPDYERQADMFAMRLLCPACVLWGLDLHTSDQIAKHCKVDDLIANARCKRMKKLYERNMFCSSQIEKSVYEKFDKYIAEAYFFS